MAVWRVCTVLALARVAYPRLETDIYASGHRTRQYG